MNIGEKVKVRWRNRRLHDGVVISVNDDTCVVLRDDGKIRTYLNTNVITLTTDTRSEEDAIPHQNF